MGGRRREIVRRLGGLSCVCSVSCCHACAQELPRARKALFADTFEGRTNPFKTSLQRTMVWTMLMLSLIICARSCLLTTFCPEFSQFELPTDPSMFDADGVPQYMKATIKRWKGNDGAIQQVRATFRGSQMPSDS